MVELTEHSDLSRETIRRRLHENELKPWQRKMWCIAKVDGEYIARMENVLDLYTQPAAANHPVVSFDESPVQLIGEVREPVAALPGQVERYDSEYQRNGTANLFVMVDVHQPWRHVKVTDQRTGQDFAACMRDLVDQHYPQAQKIRVVLDNLSTHSAASLYNSFAPQEARRIMSKIEFNFVPRHASWLNMVEIEIGVLRMQCLDRRIAERAELESGDRRLGVQTQCESGEDPMDVRLREGAQENARRLRQAQITNRCASTRRLNRSTSLCRGTSSLWRANAA